MLKKQTNQTQEEAGTESKYGQFFQMKGVYLISTLIEKRVNVFRAINNESKET